MGELTDDDDSMNESMNWRSTLGTHLTHTTTYAHGYLYVHRHLFHYCLILITVVGDMLMTMIKEMMLILG